MAAINDLSLKERVLQQQFRKNHFWGARNKEITLQSIRNLYVYA